MIFLIGQKSLVERQRRRGAGGGGGGRRVWYGLGTHPPVSCLSEGRGDILVGYGCSVGGPF